MTRNPIGVLNICCALIFSGALMLPLIGKAAPTTADFERLPREIEHIRVENRVPGVALIVADRDGMVWSAGLGVANNDTRNPGTHDRNSCI